MFDFSILRPFSRLASAAALLVAATASAQEPIAEIPFQYENNRIRLTATLDNEVVDLLLDSGASTTVLFTSGFDGGAATTDGATAKINFPALGTSVRGRRLEDVSFDLGPLTVNIDKAVMIADAMELKDRLLLRYDGILGQEFYQNYTVEVSPGTKTLRLYPPGTSLKGRYWTQHTLYLKGTAPHIRFRTQMPWEQSATVKEMLVDTGYPGAMVIWSHSHFKKALTHIPRRDRSRENIGIVGRADFRFGKLLFRHTPVFLGAEPPSQASSRDGLIGGLVLNNFSYAIDFTGEKMWMLAKKEPRNFVRHLDNTVYAPNDEEIVETTFRPPIPTVPTMVLDGN